MVGIRRLTRRDLFKHGASGVLGLVSINLLAACGQQSAAAPPTVAPAAGTRPAAQTPAAPGTPAAAQAGKPASKAGARIGSNLIGTLEGPTIVTDAAQFPKGFKEAPQLAELVRAGKLPPVQERIGQDPLVVKPVHEIGTYGGTWRRGFTGPGDKWNGYRAGTGPDHVLFWDYTGEKIVPNVARSWEFQDGGKVLLVSLRRGMKWSDGQPFTADDFVFWFENLYSNQELLPAGNPSMRVNGKPGRVEKADDLTVRYVFPEPYYLLADMLAGATPLGSQSHYGRNCPGGVSRAAVGG